MLISYHKFKAYLFSPGSSSQNGRKEANTALYQSCGRRLIWSDAHPRLRNDDDVFPIISDSDVNTSRLVSSYLAFAFNTSFSSSSISYLIHTERSSERICGYERKLERQMFRRPGKEACGSSWNHRLVDDREGVYRMGWVNVGYCGGMCDRHVVVCLTLIIRVTGMEIGKWERVSKWERVPGWMKQIIQISSNTLFVSNSQCTLSLFLSS